MIPGKAKLELEPETKTKLLEARRFAKKLGGSSRRSFLRSVHTINRFKNSGNLPGVTMYLDNDWVEHSFAWGLLRRENGYATRAGINGGMILHGYQETLSVELNPATAPHWSVHT